MATTVKNTTFQSTYKDDFIEEDNYHRVLFNSGKALQARELTQLQTIIQEEITRMGSNLFVEGGVVNGSGYTVNKRFEFIKLASNQLPADNDIPSLIGLEITEQAPNTGVKFKISQVIKDDVTGDADTLYGVYTSTSGGTSGTEPVRIGNGSILAVPGFSNMVTASTNATGVGTKVSVSEGSFFVQGRFVYAPEQSIILSFYESRINKVVGFKVTEEVVTITDDADLYDNQGAVPNVAAPGADRYRIRLTLIDEANIQTGETFVYLFKLIQGRISDEVRGDNSFNRINDLMALRTNEESGDYIVKDFTANFELDSANTGPNIILKVSDGVAYVDGYRVDASAKDITLEKARTTTTIEGEIIRASYGNFIDVYGGTDNKGLPDIHNFQKVQLTNDSDYAGAKIGTARVRALYEQGSDTYRAYLFDIKMNPGQSFSTAKSIGYDSADYMNFVLTDNQAILQNTSQSSLLFPLPRKRPDTIDPGDITVQRRITFNTGVGATTFSGTGSIPGPGGGNGPGPDFVYTNASQWILSDSGGNIINSPPDQITNTTFDFSGLTQSTNYEVLAMVRKTTANTAARPKTLNETTLTKTWPTQADSDGFGTLYFNLDKADIYSIKSIKQTDSDGADLSDNFVIDNGQRDNFYGLGRLILKTGASISGNIFTRFNYFTHGNGDFFDVTSYPTNDVPYHKIPNHTLSTGETINLRDFMDFRPVAVKGPGDGSKTFGSYMTFDSNGLGGQPIVNLLPENNSVFSVDATYYQPRIDRLVATTRTVGGERIPRGEVKVIKGTPDLSPEAPPTPSGSLSLYDLKLNAYTLNESDTTETLIPAKGFTMADISQLEKRVENLEELTTLSLLELDTTSLTVLDSDGLTRTKAGFLVDNFKNYTFSGIDRDEYRAVIDETDGILEPITLPKNTRLNADSGNSTNISFLGDAAYLSIDSDVVEIDQNLATEAVNVNPFAVIISKGFTELSPETDEWVEIKYLPDEVQNQGSLGTISRARARNLLRSSFSAAAFRNSWIGRNATRVTVNGRSGSIRRVIGGRVVDISLIPFMRSRIVHFRTQGLKPNTEHFLSFGGVEISAFARSETTFKRMGARANENVRSYTNATSHPSGSSSLVSDASGKILGSFLIPSTPSLKFRTGTQMVQLMDVTGGRIEGSTSNSTAFYDAVGNLEQRQRTIGVQTFRIQPPPPPPPQESDNDNNSGADTAGDPLAQSFYVDPVNYPNGMFITEVDAFFKTKDTDGTPVRMEIRAVRQGYPDEIPLPGASTFVESTNVQIPSDLNNITAVRAAPTPFRFDEPVYLQPARSYAVVLLAESLAYNAYVAKTYDFVLGSTEKKVNKQPTLGSLFLSQSGITWTADQTKDLMFRLKRAQFASSGTVKLENASTANVELPNNPILTTSGSSNVKIFQEGHGFNKGDYVTISGLENATYYGGLLGSDIMGSYQIDRVDHTGYIYSAGSDASGTLRVGGNGVIASGQAMYDQFVPQINTLLPNTALVSATVRTVSGSSYGSSRNTVSTGSKVVPTSKPVLLNEFNFTETPMCIFTDSNEALAPLSGTKSFRMDLNLTTADDKVSPVIDLQRNSVTSWETVLDTQDSDDFGTFNEPLVRVPETDALSGTSAAKHITSPVVLEEPAKGLKILFAGNRPSTSKFKVFFKTATPDESLDDIAYTEQPESTNNPSDEDREIFRQYEYLPGGIGGTLPDFTQFQVKIVMIGTNTAKAPKIKDLRVIALVT